MIVTEKGKACNDREKESRSRKIDTSDLKVDLEKSKNDFIETTSDDTLTLTGRSNGARDVNKTKTR